MFKDCSWPGLPGNSDEAPQSRPAPGSTQQVLPQLQKNQKPSTLVLKYLDGITRRIGKILDSCFQKQNVQSIWFVSFWLSCIFLLTACLPIMVSIAQEMKAKYDAINDEEKTTMHTALPGDDDNKN